MISEMDEANRRVRVKLEHKARDGCEGWVPIELLSNEGTEAIVLHDYSARELAVQPGEEVVVEDARHNWLLVRNAHGKRGWIPECNIEPPAEVP
jgi:SH3-like domain-containing protein